jgi:hypothetical protein
MSEHKFECDQCGQRLSAAADEIGMAVMCPACGAEFVVPPPSPGPQPVLESQPSAALRDIVMQPIPVAARPAANGEFNAAPPPVSGTSLPTAPPPAAVSVPITGAQPAPISPLGAGTTAAIVPPTPEHPPAKVAPLQASPPPGAAPMSKLPPSPNAAPPPASNPVATRPISLKLAAAIAATRAFGLTFRNPDWVDEKGEEFHIMAIDGFFKELYRLTDLLHDMEAASEITRLPDAEELQAVRTLLFEAVMHDRWSGTEADLKGLVLQGAPAIRPG